MNNLILVLKLYSLANQNENLPEVKLIDENPVQVQEEKKVLSEEAIEKQKRQDLRENL